MLGTLGLRGGTLGDGGVGTLGGVRYVWGLVFSGGGVEVGSRKRSIFLKLTSSP